MRGWALLYFLSFTRMLVGWLHPTLLINRMIISYLSHYNNQRPIEWYYLQPVQISNLHHNIQCRMSCLYENDANVSLASSTICSSTLVGQGIPLPESTKTELELLEIFVESTELMRFCCLGLSRDDAGFIFDIVANELHSLLVSSTICSSTLASRARDSVTGIKQPRRS